MRDRLHLFLLLFLLLGACAPHIVDVIPTEGTPGTVISVSMKYLVGWPRLQVGGEVMEWPELQLVAKDPQRSQVPGEELVWIEDKILRFAIPAIPPGEYVVTIHDDKGPPGDPVYSILETTAYVAFPPVWPYVFRSNQARFDLRVLPGN